MSSPAFLIKLWHILQESVEDVISWSEDGMSFIIKDQIAFTSDLLPKYYKHNNISSFIRQLNKYGFKKVSELYKSTDLQFEHPQFRKGEFAAIFNIKRRCGKKETTEEAKKEENKAGEPSSLEAKFRLLQERQEDVERQLIANKIERDTLWREYSILRQKQQEQSKVINRLVQFLILLIRSNGNNRRSVPLMLKEFIQPSTTNSSKVTEIHETPEPVTPVVNFTPVHLAESLLLEPPVEENQEEKRGLKRKNDETGEGERNPAAIVVSSSEADNELQPELEVIKDFLMYDNISFPSMRDLFGAEDPLGLKLPETFWRDAQEENDSEIVVYDGFNLNADLFDY